MKHLNEHERILAVFGLVLMLAAVGLSLATEIGARRYLAEYQKQVTAEGGVIQQGHPIAPTFKHVGFEQQTLASRWSFPDGHGTLGAGFALFGLILVAVPRVTAKKRQVAA
jgi:membrane-associated phospholipid phosphatase